MEILHNFGIQPTLLLAQVVNFAIIFFLLKKFFFAKIVAVLEERKKKIEESLKNADLIEEKLQTTEEQTKKATEEARKSATSIIEAAKIEAQRISDEAVLEARKTQEETVLAAHAQIEAQKEEMKKSLEKETLVLVTEVVKKVLGKGLNQKEKQELTTIAANEIGKQIH